MPKWWKRWNTRNFTLVEQIGAVLVGFGAGGAIVMEQNSLAYAFIFLEFVGLIICIFGSAIEDKK